MATSATAHNAMETSQLAGAARGSPGGGGTGIGGISARKAWADERTMVLMARKAITLAGIRRAVYADGAP